MLGLVVLVAWFAHAADPLEVPRETAGIPFNPAKPGPPPIPFAAGSVPGPWAFMELGTRLGAATFVDPEYYGDVSLQTTLSAGWGFEAGKVHLRPSMRFAAGYQLTLPDAEVGTRWSLSPIALSLAATNLVDEPRTGLRLTPAFGMTIPTLVEPGIPLTTLSLAAQLERRFGPFEVALRTEVDKPFYVSLSVPPCASRICVGSGGVPSSAFNWAWVNTLQAEGWIIDSLSVGASLGYGIFWRAGAVDVVDEYTPKGLDSNGNPIAGVGAGRRDLTRGNIFVNWAFTRLFGVSLDITTVQTPLVVGSDGVKRVRFPFLSFGSWADNATTFSINFWFRTDVALARMWIER